MSADDSLESPLRDANEQLYRALTAGDMDAMEALWLPVDWAECVHPGWPALRGWDAIRKSWQAIFQAPSTLGVTISEVNVRLIGTMGLVSCVERIASQGEDFLDTSLAQATNIFLNVEGAWRLVHHQASHIVAAGQPTVPEPESIN